MDDYFIAILDEIMSTALLITELISKQLSLFDFTHYVKKSQINNEACYNGEEISNNLGGQMTTYPSAGLHSVDIHDSERHFPTEFEVKFNRF
jgi:hypothetical protein